MSCSGMSCSGMSWPRLDHAVSRSPSIVPDSIEYVEHGQHNECGEQNPVRDLVDVEGLFRVELEPHGYDATSEQDAAQAPGVRIGVGSFEPVEQLGQAEQQEHQPIGVIRAEQDKAAAVDAAAKKKGGAVAAFVQQ